MSGDYQHVELAADVANGEFEPKYRSGSPPNDNYPPMPEYFWPDGFTVAATYQGAELGFRITQEECEDGLAPALFAKRLKALREALWAGAHWSNDHLRVADLRTLGTSSEAL